MAIADKLTQLNNVKLAIKNAIINKGVDMTGVAFTEYATKINSIETGASNSYSASADGSYTNNTLTVTKSFTSATNVKSIVFGGYSRKDITVTCYGTRNGSTVTLGTVTAANRNTNAPKTLINQKNLTKVWATATSGGSSEENIYLSVTW